MTPDRTTEFLAEVGDLTLIADTLSGTANPRKLGLDWPCTPLTPLTRRDGFLPRDAATIDQLLPIALAASAEDPLYSNLSLIPGSVRPV